MAALAGFHLYAFAIDYKRKTVVGVGYNCTGLRLINNGALHISESQFSQPLSSLRLVQPPCNRMGNGIYIAKSQDILYKKRDGTQGRPPAKILTHPLAILC